MTQNLYDALSVGFFTAANRPCFQFPDGSSLSYGEFGARVDHLAALLVSRGVRLGDRVMAQTPKSPDAVALYLASIKIGAIFVPLNTAYTAAEVRYFVEDAEPALFVDNASALAQEALSNAQTADLPAPGAG